MMTWGFETDAVKDPDFLKLIRPLQAPAGPCRPKRERDRSLWACHLPRCGHLLEREVGTL
jgi:hypothetical protein